MSEPLQGQPQPADAAQLAVPSYQPPAQVASNVPDLGALIAQISAQVEARVRAELGVQAAEPAQSPEQLARAALDRGGKTTAGHAMGLEERLNELHTILSLIASKVGI